MIVILYLKKKRIEPIFPLKKKNTFENDHNSIFMAVANGNHHHDCKGNNVVG